MVRTLCTLSLIHICADNEKHRPVMIHRVVLGSIERFTGVITEHFAGAFPLWLSPVQVEVLPVSNAFNDYGAEVAKKLDEAGIRVHLDDRNEKIGYKIREAQLQKTPYMLVVGDREKNDGTVSVRTRAGEDLSLIHISLRQRNRVLGVRRKHPNRGLLFQQYLRLVHNRAGKR